MATILRSSRFALAVWAGLTLATLVSWWLGTKEGGEPGAGASVGPVLIIVVTFVKVRFIAWHFMEARSAPLLLRVVLDAYVVGVGGMLIGMYLLTV